MVILSQALPFKPMKKNLFKKHCKGTSFLSYIQIYNNLFYMLYNIFFYY